MDLHQRRPLLRLSVVYEASVTSAVYPHAYFARPLRQLPLSGAVKNTSIFVLDRASGPNVCQGYLDLPETTAKVFTKRPHVLGEGKMSLTGDLGYWQAGGLLNFAGRIDSQVKIREQRIVEHASTCEVIGRHIGQG